MLNFLQPNDTQAIRARNRQTIRNAADQRWEHAVLAVQERLEAILAVGITQALREQTAISPDRIVWDAQAIVATVNAIMKGHHHE